MTEQLEIKRANGPEPPLAEPPKLKTLVTKLCEVMATIGWVPKTGYNEFHKYKYAQEADLVDALRSELAKRQIFIFPNVTNCQRVPIEVETYKGIRKTQLTEINVEWTFVDGESGETWAVNIPGVGEDNVDKGFYKAFTGSEKYMLMKSFLIPTGDDPEKDSKEETKEAKKRGTTDAGEVAKRKIAELKAKKPEPPKCLFYTLPERHNGNEALLVNLKEFGAGLDQVAAEGLRAILKKYSHLSKDGDILVAREKLDELIGELDRYGVPMHELGAND